MERVGYWWSNKKESRISGKELGLLLLEKNVQFVKLDLDSPLESQGPFSLIIHKLSDIVIKADRGDTKSKDFIDSFERYIQSKPDLIIIDPFDKCRILLNRYLHYDMIQNCQRAYDEGIYTPTFAELTCNDVEINAENLRKKGVCFPIVCKPSLAHGNVFAHQMSLIFNENGLKNINPPCVAQTFINHNARLFKLFVMKKKYYVVERPSLKNFKVGDFETLYFDTTDISKADSSSELTELDADDQDLTPLEPEKERFDRLVEILSDLLGLKLFGIDVVIENKTKRYYIIDMNLFPGYDGVTNFLEILRDMIIEEINERNKKLSEARGPRKESNSYETDSGIETSDSCDEAKKSMLLLKPAKKSHKAHQI